jgi:hypothetical protein
VFNLTANPRTIKQNASAALNWTITNPTALCKIIAVPTITAPTAKCDTSCIISRQNEATRLSTALLKGTTDSSDPFGASRNMTSALTQLVGGKAQGRKSIQMKYSNYFIGSCGLNPLQDINAIKVRVQVADDIEG